MIRPALPGEATELTALAIASKAHWGYDDAFMASAAPELEIRPEQIASRPFYVADVDGRPGGFYGLSGTPPVLVLDYLFVRPQYIGSGLGRRLWEHALEVARQAGAETVELESEPNAEGFYRSRGAVRVGEVRASTGRLLPLMRVEVRQGAPA